MGLRRLSIGTYGDLTSWADAMGAPQPEGPPSLLGITVRRSFVAGRVYFIVGLLYVFFLSIALSFSGPSSFDSGFPIILPIFTVLGAIGGLTVFANDRIKGTFEYLLAYGVHPRRIFTEILITSLALVTIELGLALALGLGIYVALGNALSGNLLLGLGLYAIPESYACAALMAMLGVFWTSLSSPRAGLNSPVGFAPGFGILPQIVTLILSGVFSAYLYDVLFGNVAVVVVIVLALLSLTNRLMPRERLLSPA